MTATEETIRWIPRPWGDRILVRREAAEGVTKGGIVLPDAARNPPSVGEVVAIGPKVDPEFFEVGSRVLFQQFAGAQVEINGENYHILTEREVFLRLDRDPAGV